MTDKRIRVLVVDGDGPFRQAVCEILGDIQGVTVVGEAETGREAVELARTLAPDVVLLAADVLVAGGRHLVLEMSELSPPSRVIVVGDEAQESVVLHALRQGAWGHLVRGESDPTEVLEAIRVVNRGGTYLSPRMAGHVLDVVIRERRHRAGIRA
jgi:DNA-binding NarL/FixJ family response regulator